MVWTETVRVSEKLGRWQFYIMPLIKAARARDAVATHSPRDDFYRLSRSYSTSMLQRTSRSSWCTTAGGRAAARSSGTRSLKGPPREPGELGNCKKEHEPVRSLSRTARSVLACHLTQVQPCSGARRTPPSRAH